MASSFEGDLQAVVAGLQTGITAINTYVWGVPFLALLLATHLFLTIRLRFIQRYLGKAIRLSFSRKAEGSGDISHFAALSTALAATVGTGNIIGVATAIAAGGPGAVFWMWMTGILGIATKYAEAVLAIKYRIQDENGQMLGGPMYAIERGLKLRWLAVVFAVFTAIAAFGIGNTVQSNAIASLAFKTFGISPWITGLVMTVATGLVLLGGIRSIARVCEGLVPFMALFYIGGCLVLLAMGIETLPHTFELIIRSAFTGHAAVGGFLGAGLKEAIRFGVARGLFSNESGLGSAPIVAAAAQTTNPVRQALVSASGTFWDTVVICLLTGLVLVNSGQWLSGASGDQLTHAAFQAFPIVGPTILTIALFTFVYSTLLGWSYYGEKAVQYLFGVKSIRPYRLVWVGMVMLGSILQMDLLWSFADLANAFMAFPNLISLFALSPVIVAETRQYLWEKV